LALPSGAQISYSNGQLPNAADSTRLGSEQAGPFSDNTDPVEYERRLKALNGARQKAMVADTDKLLKLTAEFNAEVAAGHPDNLTVAQLRRLTEIEKLARSVKEKMSTSVRGTAAFPRISPEYR